MDLMWIACLVSRFYLLMDVLWLRLWGVLCGRGRVGAREWEGGRRRGGLAGGDDAAGDAEHNDQEAVGEPGGDAAGVAGRIDSSVVSLLWYGSSQNQKITVGTMGTRGEAARYVRENCGSMCFLPDDEIAVERIPPRLWAASYCGYWGGGDFVFLGSRENGNPRKDLESLC